MSDSKSQNEVARGARGAVEVPSDRGAIDAFLQSARSLGPTRNGKRGRLVFALDATMSRQPTWDLACSLQGEMFSEAARVGGLDVQLVYFRGFSECRASRFVADPRALTGLMQRIDCRGGHTQIQRVLEHVRSEGRDAPVHALVFVGDAMEERLDDLCAVAGELGLRGVKAFMFHEGGDPAAGRAFQEIARLTGGAYARFDASAPGQLAALLRAAAAYAAGGRAALEDLARRDTGAQRLLGQMR
ncbi:VWA domain-containing protein [Alsobacter soli]|uniref:VWA domain-containing protein n=1 Tax=Alsobacter soli TaxID=2109933 RepID=UPI0018AD4767|nr:VWA domain-containing protein [Alsobacter soli]